ncbi:hypothetical protein DL96DRAFT_710099 [Flagelloscypha sp. PMI_526]|nr:hypothetical protein DL96DRAFT_710099 [Flagelloscypha sp. PMI_526]
MWPSQSKDLKSFFGTLTAHGNPHAQSQLGRSTLKARSRLDVGLSAAGTTLQLTKDAGEAASKVPYVKAVAGVLSQIIRIRDEIRANKERCEEIIDLIQLKSRTILQLLDKIYEVKGGEGFEDLRSDLEEYADFLQAVLREELEPFKTQSPWTMYINRGQHAGDLQRLERELEGFKDRFLVKRQVDISVSLLSKFAPPAKVIPQALPPSPKLVIGRDSVIESVVGNILSSPEPRMAILGPGGIGKTTIGTTVLHDPQIVSAYPTKYFVSSELAPTVDLLVICIADALSIPQSERGTDLVSQIVYRINGDPHSVLLYIDNLETVWEIEEERPKVDRFLEVLSGARSELAILITMRGIQEPKTSFPWDTSILHGLDSSSSITMYEKLSKKPVDPPAHELLLKLSGSPLAIELFALMIKEGDSSSQLLSSWNEHGTKAFEVGGKHWLSSLEQSIHISVFSPRINDTGRLVLGLIALMPDGLSTSAPWFEGFESVLPHQSLLEPILRAVRRTALLDRQGEPSRWQMLPPIRQFCLQFVDSTSSAVASLTIVRPEMANIRGVLLHGCNLQPLPPSIGLAITIYAGWADWQNIDESNVLFSLIRLPIPTGEKAYIYRRLGKLDYYRNRVDAAEASFTQALELYGKIRDRVGEARTHVSIGDIYVHRGQLDAAEYSFTRALELFHELGDRLGEANTHQSMGELFMSRNHLNTAETWFTCALEMYRVISHQLGEANSHKYIGDLNLYKEIGDRLGEANTYWSIGDLYMLQEQLDNAEAPFTLALELYGEVGDQLKVAEISQLIEDIRLRRDRQHTNESMV